MLLSGGLERIFNEERAKRWLEGNILQFIMRLKLLENSSILNIKHSIFPSFFTLGISLFDSILSSLLGENQVGFFSIDGCFKAVLLSSLEVMLRTLPISELFIFSQIKILSNYQLMNFMFNQLRDIEISYNS